MAQTPGNDTTSFTARVEGHGLVDWTPGRIDAYAIDVLRTHGPSRRWTARWRTTCRACERTWPCGHVVWAEQWGRSSAKAVTTR